MVVQSHGFISYIIERRIIIWHGNGGKILPGGAILTRRCAANG
jgi:hypothetical protein